MVQKTIHWIKVSKKLIVGNKSAGGGGGWPHTFYLQALQNIYSDRNVTPTIMYLYIQKKYMLDKSVRKKLNLLLGTISLVVSGHTPSAYRRCRTSTQTGRLPRQLFIYLVQKTVYWIKVSEKS